MFIDQISFGEGFGHILTRRSYLVQYKLFLFEVPVYAHECSVSASVSIYLDTVGFSVYNSQGQRRKRNEFIVTRSKDQ